MSCGCGIRAMVSEVPLMYGTVAIVTVVQHKQAETITHTVFPTRSKLFLSYWFLKKKT